MLLPGLRRDYGIKQSRLLASGGRECRTSCRIDTGRLQINQNTEISKADLTARSYEIAMQFNLAMMGENPSAALAKAGTDPSSLTDEELLVINHIVWNWWNHDTRYELLIEKGLGVDADWDVCLKNDAGDIFASDPVSAEIWKRITSLGFSRDWERVVDAEVQKREPNGTQKLLERLRKAAGGD